MDGAAVGDAAERDVAGWGQLTDSLVQVKTVIS